MMRDRFHLARLLSYVTGLVNQELLLRNEYLAAENRILRAHLPARLRLSDAERSTLAEIAKRLGRKALQEIARVAKPDTVPLANSTGAQPNDNGAKCHQVFAPFATVNLTVDKNCADLRQADFQVKERRHGPE